MEEKETYLIHQIKAHEEEYEIRQSACQQNTSNETAIAPIKLARNVTYN